MGKINVLTQETFNKIAAGEVVERPASVVKEALENAIDAKATEIHVEIEGGGIERIRIVDNGEGILEEDLKKAFLPHATSKIRTAEDLFSVRTMGFRGEALSSIASVSKARLRSKAEEGEGREIYIEGGDLHYEKYAPMDRGTLLEISSLFYNVPARKKFLKTPSREGTLVNEVVSRLALAHPQIAFVLVSDGREILRSYGSGSQKDVIRQVYNKKIHDHLIELENHFDALSVTGFIGAEEIARGSRSQQSIFVNGRLVQSKVVTAAVEQAFRSYATVSKFPFFVLNIEIYPEIIDVNIHPQKAEIKFEDERHIFRCVFDTVHGTLSSALRKTFDIDVGEMSADSVEQLTVTKDPIHIDIPVNVMRKPVSSMEEGQGDSHMQGPLMREWTDNYGSTPVEAVDAPEGRKSVKEGAPKFPMPRIIGQFRNTYILAELYDELYLIDQHAAHEKINYEAYLRQLKEGAVHSQTLLLPQILELSLEDFTTYKESQAVLEKAGFVLEDFGDKAVSVREVPYFLGKIQTVEYIHEILDNLGNLGSGSKEEVKQMRIATAACKSSIKAYEPLSMEEMRHLLETLRHIDAPFTCPHGRPTLVKLTEKDLQKMFRRIV